MNLIDWSFMMSYIIKISTICFTFLNTKMPEQSFSATCRDPMLVNGSFNITESPILMGYYSVGTNVTFSCDSGFILDGSNSSTCHKNGSWNPSPPTCRQGNCTVSMLFPFCMNLLNNIFLSVMKLSPTITLKVLPSYMSASRACRLSSAGGDSSCLWVFVYALGHNLGQE